MMKITMASMAVLAMFAFSTPASLAGEEESEIIKSDATCSCTARHEAMLEIRDYLKEMKAEQEAEAAAAVNGAGDTVVPEEENQAGS
jgi:hypothetical protein